MTLVIEAKCRSSPLMSSASSAQPLLQMSIHCCSNRLEPERANAAFKHRPSMELPRSSTSSSGALMSCSVQKCITQCSSTVSLHRVDSMRIIQIISLSNSSHTRWDGVAPLARCATLPMSRGCESSSRYGDSVRRCAIGRITVTNSRVLQAKMPLLNECLSMRLKRIRLSSLQPRRLKTKMNFSKNDMYAPCKFSQRRQNTPEMK